MTERIATGWRAFSRLKQASISTGAALAFSVNYEGDAVDTFINGQEDDAEEINGYEEATQNEILNYLGDGVHSRRALPSEIVFFMGLVLGKVTSFEPDNVNDPGIYNHYVERDLSITEPKYVTMVENRGGGGQKKYIGTWGKSCKILGDAGGFVRLEAELGNRGEEATDATARPAQDVESYLRYGDVDFNRGGSLSGTVAGDDLAVGGSPTSFKSKLKSFEYQVSNEANPIYELGDATGFVSRVERGDRMVHTLSALFEKNADDHKTPLIAGTEYVVSIPIVGSTIAGGSGSFKYTGELIFPKCVYTSARIGRDGTILTNSAEFKVMEDTTFGSVIVKVINKVPSYLT